MFVPSAPPPSLLDFIRQHSRFLIAGHKEPDADCIGSQIALSLALRRLGKEAILCSAGPFKRPEIADYAPRFVSTLDVAARKDAAVIIVDCAARERTGELERQLEGLPVAVIDHHATEKNTADARFVDRDSPSTTLLIYALIMTLCGNVTREEAELLFLGFCADTGFFRHLDSTTADAIAIAAELVRGGASPKKTFAVMTGGKTLNSRLLLGAILGRARPYFNGRLILSTEEMEERERYGLESRDSDSLYQLLLSIEGVEAVAVLRQESSENCTAGLRSRDSIDVSLIAAHLGGGGHKNASGILFKGSIPQLKEKLLDVFTGIFLSA